MTQMVVSDQLSIVTVLLGQSRSWLASDRNTDSVQVRARRAGPPWPRRTVAATEAGLPGGLVRRPRPDDCESLRLQAASVSIQA